MDDRQKPGVEAAPKKKKQSEAKNMHSPILTAGALLLCTAILIAGIKLTWSAYTSNDSLKSTVATNEAENLFASNVLSPYTNDPNDGDIAVKNLVFDKTGTECSFDVQIYNYLLDDNHMVNSKDVSYTLSINAVDAGDWSVSPTVDNATFTLPGLKPTMHTYRITFPTSQLDQAVFTIKATPTAGGTNLACLAAKIVPNSRVVVTGPSVSGEISEQGRTDVENAKPADFDAYTFDVSIGGASTDVILSWNANVVDIEPFFQEKYGVDPAKATTDAAGTKQLRLHLEPGTYPINFYRKNVGDPASWATLGLSVRKAS